MLQFAVGFVITPSCRGGRSKPKTRWNQKWAAGPHKSKTTQRSKLQVHKSEPSELRWEHPQVKAQAEGGGAGKQPEQKQGIKICLKREYTALYAKCLPDLILRSLRKNSSSIPARIHRTAGGGFLHLCPIPKETLNWLKEPF